MSMAISRVLMHSSFMGNGMIAFDVYVPLRGEIAVKYKSTKPRNIIRYYNLFDVEKVAVESTIRKKNMTKSTESCMKVTIMNSFVIEKSA